MKKRILNRSSIRVKLSVRVAFPIKTIVFTGNAIDVMFTYDHDDNSSIFPDLFLLYISSLFARSGSIAPSENAITTITNARKHIMTVTLHTSSNEL